MKSGQRASQCLVIKPGLPAFQQAAARDRDLGQASAKSRRWPRDGPAPNAASSWRLKFIILVIA